MFWKKAFDRQALKEGFVYFLFTAVIIALQFSLYLLESTLKEQMDFGGYLFFFTASLSHATLFALPPFLLFILILYLTRSKLAANTVHITLMVLLNTFLFINSYVFALYKFHINGFVLNMLFSEGGDEIFVFDTKLYLKVALYIGLIIAANIVLRYAATKLYKRLNRCFFVPALITFGALTLFSNLYYAYCNVVQKASVVRSASHLPYYFPLTANRLMVKLGVIEPDAYAIINLNNGKGSDICYPLKPLQVSHDSIYAKPKNIILILVDSWNYRTFNRQVVPNIMALADSSQVFARHMSSANGTQGGVFGLFYGIPANYWKDFNVMGIQPLLMNEVRARGYNVNAFASASLVNPPFIKMLFANDKHIRDHTDGKTVYDRDCRITRDYISYLDTVSHNRPFFSMLFYDLAHGISLPKEKLTHFRPTWEYTDYTILNNNYDPTPFFNLYRNCVAVIDSLVGQVIEKLKEENLLQNSVVIITGDHGQEFNENKKNYWGHKSNFSQTQLHVPFIYYDASIPHHVYGYRTTHYDVSPTLMHNVLGIENDTQDYSRGYLLTDSKPRNWHYVGDNLDYGFIIEKNIIIKLQPTGRYEITDSLLNDLGKYPVSPKAMSEALRAVNRFYR